MKVMSAKRQHFCLFFLVASSVNAAPILGSTNGPSTACISNGDCSTDDFLRIGVSVTDWILGIVGSVVLLMFVYGGFMLLISQGDSGKITTAKNIISSAVIGLIIVFGSFAFIQYFMKSMGFEWKGTSAYIQATKK